MPEGAARPVAGGAKPARRQGSRPWQGRCGSPCLQVWCLSSSGRARSLSRASRPTSSIVAGSCCASGSRRAPWATIPSDGCACGRRLVPVSRHRPRLRLLRWPIPATSSSPRRVVAPLRGGPAPRLEPKVGSGRHRCLRLRVPRVTWSPCTHCQGHCQAPDLCAPKKPVTRLGAIPALKRQKWDCPHPRPSQ